MSSKNPEQHALVEAIEKLGRQDEFKESKAVQFLLALAKSDNGLENFVDFLKRNIDVPSGKKLDINRGEVILLAKIINPDCENLNRREMLAVTVTGTALVAALSTIAV